MPRYRPCAICREPCSVNPTQWHAESNPVCRKCRRHLRQCLCWQCKKQFDPIGRGSKTAEAKYCSRACLKLAKPRIVDPREARKAASRARKLNKLKTWDGVPDREIFERAYGFCQLGLWCRHPGVQIALDLGWKADLAPEIDHIIPLSLGGLDVSANKRAAHRICNQSRGNRQSPDEIAFMDAHPELLLTKEQAEELPRKKRREPKPKPPPKPIPVCGCEGCEASAGRSDARFCPDCRVHANRHANQRIYYTRRGLVPPPPWWAASNITEHQAHS